MGMSYDEKDETIERLLIRNRELRYDVEVLEKAAKVKDENNLKLAEKVEEQERKIKSLEAELDKAIDNHVKLTPFEASLCVYHLAANAKLLCKTDVSFHDGRSYKYSEVLKEIAYMLLSLYGEKCS